MLAQYSPAVILIDARQGVLTQTRRHAYLVSLLGIRHVILAVNKMDLMGWSQSVFDAIVADFKSFSAYTGPERCAELTADGRLVIGETGFGTGLNFLCAWQAFAEQTQDAYPAAPDWREAFTSQYLPSRG